MKTIKQVMTSIASIKKTGKALDEKIHTTAMECLSHAAESGNVTLATKLVEAMPKSGRRKALIVWFSHNGPLTFNDKELAFRKAKGKKQRPFTLKAANEVPFYDLTQEKKPSTITVEKLIKLVQNKIKQGLDKGDIQAEDVPAFEKQLHAALVA